MYPAVWPVYTAGTGLGATVHDRMSSVTVLFSQLTATADTLALGSLVAEVCVIQGWQVS